MSFGKKGLNTNTGSGTEAAGLHGGGIRPAQRKAPAPDQASAYDHDMSEEEIAAKRAAFLAAERSNGTLPSQSKGSLPDEGVIAASRMTDIAPIQPPKWKPAPQVERAVASSRAERGSGDRKYWRFWGTPDQRSLLLAYVFWYFAGILGIHRAYCGSVDTAFYQGGLFFGSLVVIFIWPPLGVAMLIAAMIWLVADLFLMPGIMRRFKESYKIGDEAVFA